MEHHLPLLNGLTVTTVTSLRLTTRVITGGIDNAIPVIFVHGNTATARAFEELMVALAPRFRTIAMDMRGYGWAEVKPIDATRGLKDFSDDLYALTQTFHIEHHHLVGWSLGGNVAMQYAIDHPNSITSLILIAPGSPYGFGGTRDIQGTLTSQDFAGSGAGLVNQEFLKRLQQRDRSDDSPFSPRNVMNMSWFKPPFRSSREEILLEEMLLTACGSDNYPGDYIQVDSWPGVGPGRRGVGNALSPKYCNLSAFANIVPQPPVLWIRGDADQIVADASIRDIAVLGQKGILPGWPGPEVYPPQPMISQLRAVLTQYAACGGHYSEVVIEGCGHSPHIEKPEAFQFAVLNFLKNYSLVNSQ